MLHKKDKFEILKRFPQPGSSMNLTWKRTKTREELKSQNDLNAPKITTQMNYIQQGPQSAVLPGKFGTNQSFIYPTDKKPKNKNDKDTDDMEQ